MGCTYGLLFPWGVVVPPRGAPTEGALQCQAAIPFPLVPPLPSSLTPYSLPSFFLSEPLMLWGSPQVGGVFI